MLSAEALGKGRTKRIPGGWSVWFISIVRDGGGVLCDGLYHGADQERRGDPASVESCLESNASSWTIDQSERGIDLHEGVAAVDRDTRGGLSGHDTWMPPVPLWSPRPSPDILLQLPSRLKTPTPEELEMVKVNRTLARAVENNTALAEAVGSKDDLIKDLNSRIKQVRGRRRWPLVRPRRRVRSLPLALLLTRRTLRSPQLHAP